MPHNNGERPAPARPELSRFGGLQLQRAPHALLSSRASAPAARRCAYRRHARKRPTPRAKGTKAHGSDGRPWPITPLSRPPVAVNCGAAHAHPSTCHVQAAPHTPPRTSIRGTHARARSHGRTHAHDETAPWRPHHVHALGQRHAVGAPMRHGQCDAKPRRPPGSVASLICPLVAS